MHVYASSGIWDFISKPSLFIRYFKAIPAVQCNLNSSFTNTTFSHLIYIRIQFFVYCYMFRWNSAISRQSIHRYLKFQKMQCIRMLHRSYAAARLWTVDPGSPLCLKVWVCGRSLVGVSPLKVGSGQVHVPAALPPRKTQYPLTKRLGGPQSSLDVLKNRKIFCSRRESNLRRLYSDCAVRLLVVDRSGVLSWYLPARTAWKGDTTKILTQNVRNSEQYLKMGPFDLYKITPQCGEGKSVVGPGFQTKTLYALLITPMVLRAPHTNNVWRWTGLQTMHLLSYNFIHSQLQIDIIILFPQALRMFFS